MNSIFIILLGCNIYSILTDRLETTFKHIELQGLNQNQPINITWFLSGGIKNNFPGAISEASIMKSQIDNLISLKYSSSNSKILWNFVIDDQSTNTAENFIRASGYLNATSNTYDYDYNYNYDYVYIATSKFHYPRATQMINLIDSSRQYKWILSGLTMSDSNYWESIHIKNVFNDVNKAFLMIK